MAKSTLMFDIVAGPTWCIPTSTAPLKHILTRNMQVSPGKRISLRSECIDHLGKWSKLMERGVISNTKYEELQENILKD